MKVEDLHFNGVCLVYPNVFGDERGWYSPAFRDQEFRDIGFRGVVQASRSMSNEGVFRGLHFQKGNASQAKIVEVLSGEVVDFIVDLDINSRTYGYAGAFLLKPNDKMLYVPRKFAHGFLALRNETVLQYYVDNVYRPEAECGINIFKSKLNGICYNDSFFDDGQVLDGCFGKVIVNDRDKNWPVFDEREVYF